MDNRHATAFIRSTFSSQQYFRYLLDLLTNGHLHPRIHSFAQLQPELWMDELLKGYVTSADTGNEDLVIASRAALSEYCETSAANSARVCTALVRNLQAGLGQDRTVVPTLEIIAYLLYVGIFPRCAAIDYKRLCLLVQKAAYKTGNVRKLEACLKIYAAVAGLGALTDAGDNATVSGSKLAEGIAEARKRLGALLHHPWPRIRTVVVDEMFGLVTLQNEAAAERLKGVDWGKAAKSDVQTLNRELGFA